ncbi:protein kinase subdomain-containing protein PKL CAK Fmp29 [Coprinopsis sp. MPI-PUGE-AT-0042]|nr:protein kinase subdomain-containing protein PKL CAK Fmp29 [Coprinopsis sp. MPI-PUGE-AT-0042]
MLYVLNCRLTPRLTRALLAAAPRAISWAGGRNIDGYLAHRPEGLSATAISFVEPTFVEEHLVPETLIFRPGELGQRVIQLYFGKMGERRTPFNVDELMRLAAKSVGRRESDIIDFSKRAEGDHNRVFLITFKDSFQMIARIPYPITGPNGHDGIPSLVWATRSTGLRVFSGEDNKAFTPYIFMEYILGISVKDAWSFLADEDLGDIARQTAQLEAKMMALSFPAGGSLYLAKDLKKVGLKGLPLPGDERFCIHVDTRVPLWFKKRSQSQAFRGPYRSVEEALVAGACKEIAFLEQFSAPAQPIRRERWPCYNFQPQQPLDHVRNLGDTSLSPRLSYPTTLINNDVSWHPEQENIQQESDDDQYRHRLMQYHYVKATEEYNKVHHRTFTDPLHSLRGRLFESASAQWEGETLELHLSLLEAWTGGTNSTALQAQQHRPLRAPLKFRMQSSFPPLTSPKKPAMLNALSNRSMLRQARKKRQWGDERMEEQKQQIVGRWPWDDIDEEQLAK